jgi:16S rRNA (cytosine967-C5)-methyltransferase
VVQDYSSQRVGEFIEMVRRSLSVHVPFSVWDCCAASGGKSIMAKDILGEIDLTVTDVRESMLVNLKKRFSSAGIKKYKSFIADLTVPVKGLTDKKFDLILADVPCSGSGTWSRTPEQLYFFDEKKIEEYTALQKKIVSNLMPHLQPAGYLLYITCSVFSKENEEAIAFIKEKFHLEVIKMGILEGHDKKADTMFAAIIHIVIPKPVL